MIVHRVIRGLSNDPFRGHPLTLELSGFRSLRVSRYRVIYRIEETKRIVEIHLVGARKDIYEVFRQLIARAPPRR
jgi:mRNA interferase RelE/StbE